MNQYFLTRGSSAFNNFRKTIGIRIFPFDVVSVFSCNRGITRFIERSRYHKLIVKEEFGNAFIFSSTSTILISHQLLDTFMNRIGNSGGFTFNYNQRQTVNKQYDIGNNMCTDAGNLNFVLRNSKIAIKRSIGIKMVYIREINNTYRTIYFSRFFVERRKTKSYSVKNLNVCIQEIS